ncbi:pyridoxamine 5'-phosphate oxidase family protein [Streptomyces sp. A7024]|uniref:Pyridoxamine 5'-phosphate oxidase family protein n=1 Tax=Streptomyces coryli TaxID=1128680 RepID=A0A6G4UDM3_9ACTN|nr:pyridoxamine 5'-phosphate oxidase family protein [Streptomyces coryli]NGN70325.1 pyridoxamine 5'-phosphate oxidase family protein [Streptomyces coryli]
MTSRLKPDEIARYLIDGNRYMTLGTTDADGRARVTPVYYAPHGYRILYWISAPAARHSRNIARAPAVSIVIFDSMAAIGKAQAVYLEARAEQVPDTELPQVAEVACRARFPEQKPFPAAELRPPGQLRLYRARVIEHAIHIRGSDPDYGRGVDSRLPVEL